MANSSSKTPLIVVLGATGTGKSQLAVELAIQFNGEIINGDAMQIYDGLPIITNKITKEEQQGIPHHLLGCIALDEEPWVVGMFRKKASKIIKEIRSRGRLPIVVGGTHYYTQSLLFNHSLVNEMDDGEEQVQPRLSDQEISEKFPILDGPTEVMMERLKEVDPIMAARWHPNDRRKIRRSLEIFLLGGRKASDIYSEQRKSRSSNVHTASTSEQDTCQQLSNTLMFWVYSEPEILKQRLDDRVHKMLESGLLEEVKIMDAFLHEQLVSGRIVDRTRGIWVSIGWKEFEPYLAALKGNAQSQEELAENYQLAIEQTKTATRQYAKRQIRWIRLKLIPALLAQNALDHLYLLDASDIRLWQGQVSNPAIDITQNFLSGEELRSPREVCEAAKQILIPEIPDDSGAQEVSQICELCNVVCVREDQWQAHLKSRRHRALIRKRQRNPTGMSSPSHNLIKSESLEKPPAAS